MGALIVIGVVIAAVAIFELLAYRRGSESRPGFNRTAGTAILG